mgnify:CR=1 FL=1
MCSLTSGTYPIHNFTLSRMYSLTSGTYLFHLFSLFACVLLPLAHTQSIISPSLACIPLPLAHTYFTFFLFPHVFSYLWHIPISSFLFFRMYSFASGTYLFHLFCFSACIPLLLAHTYFTFFLFPHVFLCFWHIPISSFSLFRMYSFASGTYLFHLFSVSACISLLLAHTYFIFFLISHVFLCFWHIPNP